ncbi:hypothetical protein [Massilia putida]|uniref:hypothetical protein n=1 Tax=Massilia putida TaxID=1141883 RepID=UPI0012EC6F69|nr:hypothetical protein [Massilia putida]
MRPTDENQAVSRRPNLMSSSRRTNGDIHILAMLDGHAPGRRIFARPAVLWYGAAGVAACSLLVVLAWLVRGATPARDSVRAAVPTTGTTLTREAPAPTSLPVPAQTPGPQTVQVPDATRGAVIVDVAAPAPVMAPPPAPAAATPAASAHAAAHRTPARPQPASRSAPSQAASLAHADPVPRQKRAMSRTAPSSATVDTDVALISAILQHTGTGSEAADAGGAPTCVDKACNPRLPSRQ